ncbi:MAG: hypothetical protein JNL33_16590 [Betaproteobacteria bacterium]|nr:hypothetical protein [Betaproteobacteria bacterium]
MDKQCTRPLSEAERNLARWMLENGTTEARRYLSQLELAEADLWTCPCGCASFSFRVKGQPKASPGMHILGDYLLGSGDNLSGAFIYSSAGILSGVEVYGMAGDAPRVLPVPEELRRYEEGAP